MYGNEVVGDNFCTAGHDLKLLVVNRFFNCVGEEFGERADKQGRQ